MRTRNLDRSRKSNATYADAFVPHDILNATSILFSMFAIHVAAETMMALFDVSAATATPTQSIALDRIVPHPRETFSQLTGCSRRFSSRVRTINTSPRQLFPHSRNPKDIYYSHGNMDSRPSLFLLVPFLVKCKTVSLTAVIAAYSLCPTLGLSFPRTDYTREYTLITVSSTVVTAYGEANDILSLPCFSGSLLANARR